MNKELTEAEKLLQDLSTRAQEAKVQNEQYRMYTEKMIEENKAKEELRQTLSDEIVKLKAEVEKLTEVLDDKKARHDLQVAETTEASKKALEAMASVRDAEAAVAKAREELDKLEANKAMAMKVLAEKELWVKNNYDAIVAFQKELDMREQLINKRQLEVNNYAKLIGA